MNDDILVRIEAKLDELLSYQRKKEVDERFTAESAPRDGTAFVGFDYAGNSMFVRWNGTSFVTTSGGIQSSLSSESSVSLIGWLPAKQHGGGILR